MLKYGNITCKRCGITWYGPKCGKLYCEECRKVVNNEKSLKWYRSNRELVARNRAERKAMSAAVERKEEQISKLIYFNPKPSVPAKKRGVTKSKQKRKRNISPIRSLDDVQMISEYFWDKKQYRNWCLFNVGIATGLRASDLLKLKVSDITYNWTHDICIFVGICSTFKQRFV